MVNIEQITNYNFSSFQALMIYIFQIYFLRVEFFFSS